MKCFQLYFGEKKEEVKTPRPSSSLVSFSELSSQNASNTSSESRERTQLPNFSEKPSNLKVFTFPELKKVTKNFSRTSKLGEGGFGCVYKGVIKSSDDRTDVAVKQRGRRGLQGHKEWVTEVNVLGIVEHPNLVKLIGYCAEDDERGIQRLLIYEYMPNGSVEDHLSIRSVKPLSWPMRLKIVLDAARGLTYLHEEMDFQIIFRDFKSSNILLDEQWNAKLSDFGLARLGPPDGLSHVSTAVVGTMGYAIPLRRSIIIQCIVEYLHKFLNFTPHLIFSRTIHHVLNLFCIYRLLFIAKIQPNLPIIDHELPIRGLIIINRITNHRNTKSHTLHHRVPSAMSQESSNRTMREHSHLIPPWNDQTFILGFISKSQWKSYAFIIRRAIIRVIPSNPQEVRFT